MTIQDRVEMTRETDGMDRALQRFLDLQLEAYATTRDYNFVVADYAMLAAHAVAGELDLAAETVRLMAESALAEERAKRERGESLCQTPAHDRRKTGAQSRAVDRRTP